MIETFLQGHRFAYERQLLLAPTDTLQKVSLLLPASVSGWLRRRGSRATQPWAERLAAARDAKGEICTQRRMDALIPMRSCQVSPLKISERHNRFARPMVRTMIDLNDS
jgi:hypothetical protein